MGIAGHITIGDKVMLGAQSGCHSNIKAANSSSARRHGDAPAYFRAQASGPSPAELYKQINALQKGWARLRPA